MALLGNYSVIHKSPATFTGGLSIGQTRSNSDKSGSIKNSYLHFGKLAGYPTGYAAPYSWSMPMRVGSMASLLYTSLSTTNAQLVEGRVLEASILTSLTTTSAQMSAVVDLMSNIIATSLMTPTEIQLLKNLASSISASGTITSADIQSLSVILLSANLSGSISLTNAQIGALVNLQSSIETSASLTAITAVLVNISCEIGGATPLSPEGLAEAVWSKDITGYTDVNSAGRKLVNAGGAGNPWSADLATNNAVGTFGHLVQKLLKLSQFLGLK